MDTYIGTKIIQAEPAYRCDGMVYPKSGQYPRSMHMEDGYKVRYPGRRGPLSRGGIWAENEGGAMTFGLAIEAMKKGKKVARAGWNGKNQHIELASAISYESPDGTVVNAEHEAIGNQAVAFCGTSGVQMGWLASQADMLANDWKVID